MTDMKTKFGVVHYGGNCKDDYPNIRLYDQGGGRQVVKLQSPAIKAFKAAEERCGRKIPAASWRSCAYQAQLHASDPKRYADPATSGHPRGLCIDVSTAVSFLFARKIRRALTRVGWKQARPDEKWHWSWGPVI
jgi:hypothetical protein